MNNFETRKAEIVINDEDESSLFIWFSETNLKSQTELKIYDIEINMFQLFLKFILQHEKNNLKDIRNASFH